MRLDHTVLASAAKNSAAAALGVLIGVLLLGAAALWWRGIVPYNRRARSRVFGSTRRPPRWSERMVRLSGTLVLALGGVAIGVSAIVGLATS